MTLNLLDRICFLSYQLESNLHQHNGITERFNCMIQERARAFLFESGFLAIFWGLAFEAARYIYNHTPHYTVEFLTPSKKLFSKIPNFDYIKLFYTQAFVKVKNVAKGRKMDSRSTKMCVAVYTDTGYILYHPIKRSSLLMSW